MEFSEFVKKCRGDRSLRDFGDVIGVSYNAISVWESGAQVPSKERMYFIANRGLSKEARDFARNGLAIIYPDFELVAGECSK